MLTFLLNTEKLIRNYDIAVNARHRISPPRRSVLRSSERIDYHRHVDRQLLLLEHGAMVLEDERQRRLLYAPFAALIPEASLHRVRALSGRARFWEWQSKRLPTLHRAKGACIVQLSALARELIVYLGAAPRSELRIPAESVLLGELKAALSQPQLAPNIPVLRSVRARLIGKLIEERMAHPFRNADLRSALPLSTRQIERLFVEDCGLTVQQYLKLIRLSAAGALLAAGSEAIAGIAYRCGYRSLSSFFADFQRAYGLSPRGFRRRAQSATVAEKAPRKSFKA